MAELGELRERFAGYGQEHVFRFWKRLDDAGRRRLARQASAIDLERLAEVHRAARAGASGPRPPLHPAPIERLPERGGSAQVLRKARELGEDLLAGGRVGIVVVAGGQGTRLGFAGPKGAFPIGPITGRTLFGLQAEKVRRARSRYGMPIPWYIMTSPATDAAARALFEREHHFGLPADDVFFFCQSTVPSLDFEGCLMLERPDRIVESPNGHGGVLTALADSGALADMRRRGVELLSYYQVDNPLVRLADPVLLGLHPLRSAEMSCKVVRKRNPEEKMGVVARVADRVGIVEYTELDEASRTARDGAGELLYWAGNLAIHGLNTEFVSRIAAQADRLLPFHASAKKIPCLDADGRPLRPLEPNGYKLERFIFDALPAASSVAVIEVRREEEYSPVKNADGGDSPISARRDLVALYSRWLAAAGVKVPTGVRIEIDHSRIDSEEDARASRAQELGESAEGIRLAPGAV